jgi:thiamine-monophosphate kinase
MPLAQQTTRLAEEMNFDAVVAALNGGEDYELLFTVPLDMREKIINLGCVDIIGHITAESTGAYLVTPDGNDIALKAQGFTPKQ